jgi:pectate lyase
MSDAIAAPTLAEKYPLAREAFALVEESPLLMQALLDDEFFTRIDEQPSAEQALRSRLTRADFRRFGATRSVGVRLVPGTLVDRPAVILAYQTEWKRFGSLPSGGPPQTDAVMRGTGRDSMWHRMFYGGTDDPAAHAAFEALLEERRTTPSNRRRELDPRFTALAEQHLPTRPLAEIRREVRERIEKLVTAFAPYGARVLEEPELGDYGAKITDHLYLHLRDFPPGTPTRYDNDPFFWLYVSGGPKEMPRDYLPAFPGAEGMGAMATGGRGGRVIYVTTTAPDGPGSLKEALEARGPRTVLFAVSGQIDLPDWTWITQGDLTVIGYTAPGEGVEINGRLCLAAHNIILRGLRFRLRPPLTKDGMNTEGRLRNIIFDHCSFAYGSDELLRMIGGESSFYGFTIQYCLLGPGLAGISDHPYGPEVGGYGTFHHNILYNTLSRSPEVDCILIDWRHNLMANLRSGHSQRPHSRFNMVGNYIIDIPGNPNDYSFSSNDSAYLGGNLVEHGERVETFDSGYRSRYLDTPHRVMPVTATDPRELEAKLMPIAGAFLPVHDSTDRHFLARLAARESRLPHLEGGRWRPYGNDNRNMELYEMWNDDAFPPPAAGATALPDSDGDGMPDEWELAHGFDPHSPRDGAWDADGDGYTNLEEYLYGTDPREYVDYTDPANNRHTLH